MGTFSAKLRVWNPSVMAEPSDMEMIGVHTIEGLGLAADPVQKKLILTVMPALRVSRKWKTP